MKYVNPDTEVVKTVVKCIDDPRGANAEVITDHIFDTLKDCDLEVRYLKSCVSDSVSLMTKEQNGIAAIETCQQSSLTSTLAATD